MKAQSVGLVPSPEQVAGMLAVIVDDAFSEQQGRAGDGRGRRGDTDGFERLVGAGVREEFRDLHLARRPFGQPVDEVEIGDAGEVFEAHPNRARHAVAFDHRQGLGIAGIGARQLGALGILDRRDGHADQAGRMPGLVIEQLARDEVAPVRHHHQPAIGPGIAEAGEPAERVDLALHLEAALPDQALHRLAQIGGHEPGDRQRRDAQVVGRGAQAGDGADRHPCAQDQQRSAKQARGATRVDHPYRLLR